tara:strand:- start:456 stop:674 length:219 start_codon:yes stop_codon:yes gene_type:complete
MNFLKNKSILITGEIGSCCNFVRRKTSIGNIQNSSIEEIWNGSKMSNLRDGFRYNNLNKIRKSFIKSQEINI